MIRKFILIQTLLLYQMASIVLCLFLDHNRVLMLCIVSEMREWCGDDVMLPDDPDMQD
jgi:hypothetical protein